MSKIGIHPAGSKTYAPYTPAVVVGNHVWLSGQINIDAGRLPKPHGNGQRYLSIPLNLGAPTDDVGRR